MTLEHWKRMQLKKGNPVAANIADVLIEEFGDVPIPLAPNPEIQKESKRFLPEAREALVQQGYLIYCLTGQSIQDITETNRGGLELITGKDLPDFIALPSTQMEVAINPDKFFLPDSQDKTLIEQEKMVNDFSRKLQRKIPGIKAIIGQVPDYIELAFQHLDATGKFLFGRIYRCGITRTKTPTRDSRFAFVGNSSENSGDDFVLFINDEIPTRGIYYIRVAPLIVPA